MKIYMATLCETMVYAAAELKKYLEMMDSTLCAQIIEGEGADGVTLSVGEYAGIDPMVEDIIDAEIDSLKGYIRGSNGRSVLMGVYNFLKSAGCMWVRPGKKGEIIPEKAMGDHVFSLHKKADARFRGDCIEGAISLQNVLDTIEWLPKINMNLFMIQFVVPYNMLRRWYEHDLSFHKAKGEFNEQIAEEMTAEIERQVKKRGLQLHALGHGYMFENYGVRYLGPGRKYVPTEEAYGDIALIGGKRELYMGSPNLTQMCMSNPAVRRKMVSYLAGYLEKKPYIDFLHVWLADGINNHCECGECVKKRPSDFYVMMLNELDEELTARGVDTKIVFTMYTDTNWPPLSEQFLNPDRFILSTAVGERKRCIPYNDQRLAEPLPEFKRNDNHVDVDFPRTLSFFDQWQKSGFNGLKFLFEYYMYYYHYLDPGYMHMAKELYADTQGLPLSGFDGVMQCRTQRAYFPTAFPMAMYGEALFDRSLSYEAYAGKYFAAAFGAHGKEAFDYLNGVSDIFQPWLLRRKDYLFPQPDAAQEKDLPKETVERLSAIGAHLEKYAPIIRENKALPDSCQAESWKVLFFHQTYCRMFADMFITLASGDPEGAKQKFKELWRWMSETEDELQPHHDMYICARRLAMAVKYRFED